MILESRSVSGACLSRPVHPHVLNAVMFLHILYLICNTDMATLRIHVLDISCRPLSGRNGWIGGSARAGKLTYSTPLSSSVTGNSLDLLNNQVSILIRHVAFLAS